MSDADEGTDVEIDDDIEDVDGNTIPAANAAGRARVPRQGRGRRPRRGRDRREEGRRGLALNVRVGPGDMGRVIGKRGRVAQSIRTVVRAAAVKDGVSVDVEFVD